MLKTFTSKILRTSACAVLLLSSACVSANKGHPEKHSYDSYDKPCPTIAAKEFSRLSGGRWAGELTYLDFSSGAEWSIPVAMQFEDTTGNKVKYKVFYPNEPQHNATETLRIAASGDKIDGNRLTSCKVTRDGGLALETITEGKDNGKPATIRLVYEISDDLLIFGKDVRVEGANKFFRRNTYRLTRD